MKTVRVSVTKRDIAEGVPLDTQMCPVAIAIRRTTGVFVVDVTDYQFQFDSGNVDLPKRVARFVDAFDFGDKVRPFTFTLRVP
mgnify:CR=1 FL=1